MNELEQEKKDHNSLKKLHDSTNQAVMALQAEISVKDKMLETFAKEKAQWEREKIQQQLIIQQHIGGSDNNVRLLQDEIRTVKKKFKIAISDCTNDGIIKTKDLLAAIRELY